ncbi:hypothetical protein CYMTET_45472 [Cymbomonas tetramitiformis]|uniref:Uncharacterized protein n=1 Tax=Cymbomonas tetramitiformis TaxID=36881 RepID=A0AAE0BZA3_9CHLO|nr:hypothetical protein CYMTET_45473 [Cymbomonas tetramitiformis]KAK3244939.1 hypothetical protein CYMTET_45472 [Cymbomonas tetramitiformis]
MESNGFVQMYQQLQIVYSEGGSGALLMSKPVRVMFCVVGIVTSLIFYGILQERIMTQPYGDDAGRFTFSVFLVLNNRTVSSIVAALILSVRGMPVRPVAKIWEYCAVSLSNVVATTCQYEALKYVSFPVQTLGKCAKMIPVMIWGTLISRRKYTGKKYAVALIITVGTAAFLMGGSVVSKHAKKAKDTTMWGVALMLGYLGFDGFTSTFQDKLFKGYQMETYNQMLYVNLCSACVSLFGLITSGTLFPAIEFVSKYPTCLFDMTALSLCAMLGQLIILYTIKEFGALLFATVMTTRQFLSILFSCFLFAHPLSAVQWGATFIIFGALYAEAFGKSSEKESTKPETESLVDKDAELGSNLSELKGQRLESETKLYR